MQIWFSLSDEGMEDSIYDSYAMRSFMHIDFSEQQVPDATTLLKFRHMLEKHNIGEKIFADVNRRLDEAGLAGLRHLLLTYVILRKHLTCAFLAFHHFRAR